MHSPDTSHDIDVLLVGTDATEQYILSNFLDFTSKITHANSYHQAQNILKTKKVGITICEAEIQGLDYRTLCKELVEKPCVFVSSRDRDTERRKCLLKIQDCYLTRPYSLEQLLNAVSIAKKVEKATIN